MDNKDKSIDSLLHDVIMGSGDDPERSVSAKFEIQRRFAVLDAAIKLGPEQYDALQADAQRFAGLRMILCEPDKAKRDAMLEAVEKFMDDHAPPHDDTATFAPEFVNGIVDQLLLAVAGVRT